MLMSELGASGLHWLHEQALQHDTVMCTQMPFSRNV